MRYALADVLNLDPEEGIEFTDVEIYENQVYDPTMYGFPAVHFDAIDHRRLGQTHGSRGVQLSYRVYFVPSAIGFSDSDAAFASVQEHLVKAVERHVLTDVFRTSGLTWGCDALTLTEGTSVTYMSDFYSSIVTHSAYPTGAPTSIYASRHRNRAGVIAGVLLGVTAFVVVVMIATFGVKLDWLASMFGGRSRQEDVQLEAPK